ncbi:F-actin-methionine sulfoxide oxidase mical1-like [Astyanax mexicanus]|uniref:Molecule interacting with CasL protein 1 n=1 Tax=Astyanax mexicanus TaxID=7994 RepID=A0A8T2LDZ3_ASTMX|nr:F-actin-methionine sulfoxide oxidase mical1-like [Astyanax mexicanus]
MAEKEPGNPAHALFDLFVAAQTCKEVQLKFAELCRHLEVDSQDYRNFYNKLKERLNYWKAKDLWQKIDSRANHSDYEQGKPCAKTKCLVLGAGPCGLRVAIELALLGAQVVLLEKRTSFSRNNVLHLWPYTIRDLRNLGAKKFYGKFCCGSLDHISIRQLQLILLKLALLLGVEVHTGVSFKGLVEPQASGAAGWKALLHPESHPAAAYQFDVFISAGGGRFVPDGFKRKELRGKLAIGITANFVNRHTAAEAQVPEISGVARIYNQKFFQELHTEKGIDLENIVYYKDDTHYFVMTAKKNSLLKKGVIKQDFSDADQLLAPANVNQEALLQYARDAAQFSTGGKLPDMEFALNHAGQQDVAMFDFTCMHRAENASLVRERRGKKLLIGLVGDCLVEPFWPLGTGIARGFLAAFDTAWMVRNWGKGMPHLQVLSERESVYQLLSQTTPENTSKNYNAYSIDPSTRYPNVNVSSIKPKQVQHLYDEDSLDSSSSRPTKKKKDSLASRKQDSLTRLSDLLSWCQKHTAWCNRVQVKDLSQSWKSGLALCALIHHFRPKLIDMSRLKEKDAKFNNQLAFDILQREFGIEPIMSASDMATSKEIDQLSMVLYLTQVHNAFTETPVPKDQSSHKSLSLSRTRSAVFFLNKLKHNSLQRRKESQTAKREERRDEMREEEEQKKDPVSELPPAEPGSSECYFCHQQLYVLERGSAEGKFFHRSCFTCQQCGTTLRQGGYTFYPDTGRFYCEQHSEPVAEKRQEERESEPADPSTGVQDNIQPNKNEQHGDDHKKGKEEEHSEESRANESPQSFRSVKRKSSYKISIDPHCDESTESDILEKQEEEDQLANRAAKDSDKPGIPTDLSTELPCPGAVPAPVPSPRKSRTPSAHSPVPKPRTIHNVVPSPNHSKKCPEKDHTSSTTVPTTVETIASGDHKDDQEEEEAEALEQTENGHHPLGPSDPRPKLSLKKLQLTDEEKTQLVNLSFSQDSDSETPASSSAASTSSSNKPNDGGEEEGYWSGGASSLSHVREKKNRRCFRRKGEPQKPAQIQQGRLRSKFSPWNLSSPRLQQRFSVLRPAVQVQPESDDEVDADGVDDEDEEEEEEEEEDNEEALMTADHYLDGQAGSVKLSAAEKQEMTKLRTLERRAKMSELQRFHKAQSIQRRLEEIEVTFKELEEKGVVLERSLRGEPGSDGSVTMIDDWIELVQQKNDLVSEESDLMVASRQLELEDKQSMLELELRRFMEIDDSEKTEAQQKEEEQILQQMLEVVDMRNSLVAFLEEKRLKELNEETMGSSLLETKRHSTASAQVHWA